jgi:hypothetical protein
MASASRVTKAPNSVSADATTRSNRFIRLSVCGQFRFDRRGNVSGGDEIGKSQFRSAHAINVLDEG